MPQYGSNYMEQVKLEHRMERITEGHINVTVVCLDPLAVVFAP